jgi:hypothetical protein
VTQAVKRFSQKYVQYYEQDVHKLLLLH